MVSMQRAIKLSMVAVLVCYAIMWVLLPTNTWRNKWRPTVQAKLDHSSFLGSQGTILMIFKAPVLLVAALGCVYLRLTKSNDISKPKSTSGKTKSEYSLAAWKKPILVKGPLGVVSGIELTFLMMFLALLICVKVSFKYRDKVLLVTEDNNNISVV